MPMVIFGTKLYVVIYKPLSKLVITWYVKLSSAVLVFTKDDCVEVKLTIVFITRYASALEYALILALLPCHLVCCHSFLAFLEVIL